jgi:hypothetical protein
LSEGTRSLWERALLPALAALSLLVVACGNSTTASSTSTALSIPSGWKTYTYGKVAIDVPGKWVLGGSVCSDHEVRVGVNADDCNTLHPNINRLDLGPGDPQDLAIQDREKSLTINGIRLDRGLFSTPTKNEWVAPSLGIIVFVGGSDSNRILHTLRMASHH